MSKRILITGGAGFIGSHLADFLLERGFNVRILDNLSEHVHGKLNNSPKYLNRAAELIVGDIRDKTVVKRALKNTDIIYHLAAKIGVGQSMYEISDFTETNNLGTAVLLEAVVQHPVEKIVVASSMCIYGEGLYRRKDRTIVPGYQRTIPDMKKRKWELYDEQGNLMEPVPTTEDKRPSFASVYALSKYDQERLCILTGRAFRIPVVALRLFNVYGPRQDLSNPYTGIMATFASRFMNGNPPLIFEDGNQSRDFVNVKDVVYAFALACEKSEANGEVFNIASGQSHTVNEIAGHLQSIMNIENIHPEITYKYRSGDIRHCFADISKAKRILGFKPGVDIKQGLTELTQWLDTQHTNDVVDPGGAELKKRGLTI